MPSSFRHAWRRYALAARLGMALLVISFATRCALLIGAEISATLPQALGAFAMGALYDLIAAAFALAPLVVWLSLLPDRLAGWRPHRWLLACGTVTSLFLLLFIAVSEWFFWAEFGSRFNFIAIDYLLYAQEVLGNTWQSYPVGKIVLCLAALSLAAAWIWWRGPLGAPVAPIGWRARLAGVVLATLLPVALYFNVSSTDKEHFASGSLNELAGNGLYEFAAAARSNEIDYMRLYSSLPDADAFGYVRRQISLSSDGWISDDVEDRVHLIRGSFEEKRLNVVLISIESLGADYVGAWGDTRGLTPRMDALAKESLVFRQVYSSGNRTVRGLEALSLALPPTPGQSIVKRPNNTRLFSLGHVFGNKGYESLYLYGGYGYFDNMNDFFSANDYRVVDRSAIPKEKIRHENIWGVCDEDLFDLAIGEIGASLAAGGGKRRVFAHIMTTSNHRPYTYPSGRIDIPSGSDRTGAVKYSDYAVGHFMDAARKQPWFDDTLFVITADHGANARGTSEIPADKYLIPLMFHSPRHIKAGEVDRLMSQIDIAPTVLGRLGMTYRSKFFGEDIFRVPPGQERAFVANHQAMGYLRDGRMVTLLPRQQVNVVRTPLAGPVRSQPPLTDAAIVREAISWYQSASLAFRRGRYREEAQDAAATPTKDPGNAKEQRGLSALPRQSSPAPGAAAPL